MEVQKFCTICQKGPFTSVKSAMDHFSSNQHQNAEINAQIANSSFSSDPFYCKVCSEQTNGPKSFMEHMASPRHKVKMGKSLQFRAPSEPSNREYDFDGKKGYCHLCQLDLTSNEHASQHLNGSKHKKKKSQTSFFTEAGSANIRYDCRECERTFGTKESRDNHINFEHRHTQSSLTSNTDIVSALFAAQPQSQSNEELERLKKEFNMDIQNEMLPSDDEEYTNVKSSSGSDKEYTFNITTGYCNLCNVELTSLKNKEQHLSGSKHRKAKDAWLARKKNEDHRKMSTSESNQKSNDSSMTSHSLREEVEYVFDADTLTGHCNVCRVPLKSFDDASFHLTSEEHKHSKEEWLKADMSLSLNNSSNNAPQSQILRNPLSQQGPIVIDRSLTLSHSLNNAPHLQPPRNTISQQGPNVTDSQMNSASVFTKNVFTAETPFSSPAPLNSFSNNRPFMADSTKYQEETEKDSAKPDYTFTGSRGYCNLCNLELTSKQHAEQHLSGAKHQKAKAAANAQLDRTVLNQSGAEYTFTGSRGFCHVCKLDLTSRQHADQHLSGAKHRKAVNAQSSYVSPLTVSANINAEFGRSTQPETSPPQYTHLGQSPQSQQTQGYEEEYTFAGTRGYCNVCKIELTSKPHAQSHLSGKSHAKEKQRWSKGISVRGHLFCDICQITCSGPESMEQHLASKKHKEKEQLKGGPQDFIKGINSGDKTAWVICEVCKCKLNSAEQLENHKKSPKHMANEEKMYGKGFDLSSDHNVLLKRQELSQDFTTASSNQNNLVHGMGIITSGFRPTGNQSDNSIPLPIAAEKPILGSPEYPTSGYGPLSAFSGGSFGPSLRISSLQNDTPDFEINDNKSMFDMNRPQSSLLNLSSLQGDHLSGLKRFENMNLDETSPKDHVMSPDILSGSGAPQFPSFGKNMTNYSSEKEDPSKELLFKSLNKDDNNLSLKHRNDSSEMGPTPSSSSSSVLIESEEEIIIPEKTVENMPMFGKTHFDSLDMSSISSSSSKKKTSGSDEAKAIKNRPKSRTATSEPSSIESCSNSVFEDTGCAGQGKDDSFPVENIRPSLTVFTPSLKPAVPGMNLDPNSPYKFYCQTCKKPMNTQKAYNDHIQGNGHLTKVAEEEAPERYHPPMLKSENKYGRIEFDLTKTKPRSYQVELFIKTLDGDRVCFLPTGTGKTLISCMTISAMLDQNPTRQVVFLVDKVLLVLQQSVYIKREIGERVYKRFSQSDLTLTEDRPPLIAALCGGSQNTAGIPLWRHDVIVATADCYKNLLLTKVLKWTDVCLVVFDEAHHCVKNHPFNKLLQGYHKKVPIEQRPRLLGLTASPAGKLSVQETVCMLNDLMNNIGGAKIALVQENRYELKKFQSNAHMEPMFIAMTKKEQLLKDELQLYLIKCYIYLCQKTDILSQFDLGLTSKTKNFSEQELQQYAKEVDGSLLNSLEITLNLAHPKTKSLSEKITSSNMIKHVQYICMTLNVLAESGVSLAMEELQELMSHDPNANFEFAKKYGLPCTRVQEALDSVMQVESPVLSLPLNNEVDSSSQLDKLVDVISRTDYVNWSSKEAMVLVLVKQRDTAYKMKRLLQGSDVIKKLQLKVEAVVGHGNTSGTEQGMTVAQQRTVLENMKKKEYQIVVATSVAEEGIDIPECELVITFNPPSTVTALVQMRGRARKNNSKFVVLCNSSKEKDELEDLMTKEKNMMEAAEFIVQKQKQ